MTAAKYSLGVHGYEPNDAPVNVYTAGELATYQTATGTLLAGALAHVKVKDPGGTWYLGTAPALAAHNTLFLSEAKALGMVTVGAWVPESSGVNPQPWELLDDAGAMAYFDAAALEVLTENPDVDIWLFGNEMEGKEIDSDAADERANWFALERRAGLIWQGQGKLWMAGADQAAANTLDWMDERLDVYGAATPDWWALHMYGNGGFVSRQVRDVRLAMEYKLGRENLNLALTEWAIDFENLTGYGTKAWVRDYRARDFAEHIGRALRRERVYGCYFNFKEIAQEGPDYYPRQGLVDSLSDSAVHAEPPSKLPTTAGATTRRYLVEGRYANREWNAAWLAFKEYARSLVSYPGYWS